MSFAAVSWQFAVRDRFEPSRPSNFAVAGNSLALNRVNGDRAGGGASDISLLGFAFAGLSDFEAAIFDGTSHSISIMRVIVNIR